MRRVAVALNEDFTYRRCRVGAWIVMSSLSVIARGSSGGRMVRVRGADRRDDGHEAAVHASSEEVEVEVDGAIHRGCAGE